MHIGESEVDEICHDGKSYNDSRSCSKALLRYFRFQLLMENLVFPGSLETSECTSSDLLHASPTKTSLKSK